MVEDFKDKLLPMFKKFFSSHIDKESEKEKHMKFSNFIEAFQNRYIKNNQKDIYFRKKFIKKYANKFKGNSI